MPLQDPSPGFAFVAALLVACSGPVSAPSLPADVGSRDAGPPVADARAALSDGGDAGKGTLTDGGDAGAVAVTRPECQWGGAPGKCMTASACGAIADHTSETGSCATGLGCCIDTPDVQDDPPIPTGYKLMLQSQVTTAMTTWAVAILHDPVTYPMFATTTRSFGSLLVLALVEWHPPDFQNGIVHRGVTLFVPL